MYVVSATTFVYKLYLATCMCKLHLFAHIAVLYGHWNHVVLGSSVAHLKKKKKKKFLRCSHSAVLWNTVDGNATETYFSALPRLSLPQVFISSYPTYQFPLIVS